MAVRLSSGSRRASRPPELRPTAGRTLESVFSMLSGEIEGRRVLDLYSGVGSYGVMALRRGAEMAVFVDNMREAEKRVVSALRRHHLELHALIFREDVAHFLHLPGRWSEPFNLVFADPPYRTQSPGPVIEAILDSGLLARGGLLIFEHSKRQAPPQFPNLKLRKSRVFGETTVSIWDYE